MTTAPKREKAAPSTPSAPAEPTTPPAARQDWREVATRLARTPGEWEIVGRDIPVGTASRLRRNYDLEIRLEGVDGSTHRAALMWARVAPREDLSEAEAAAVTQTLMNALHAHVVRYPREVQQAFELMNVAAAAALGAKTS